MAHSTDTIATIESTIESAGIGQVVELALNSLGQMVFAGTVVVEASAGSGRLGIFYGLRQRPVADVVAVTGKDVAMAGQKTTSSRSCGWAG